MDKDVENRKTHRENPRFGGAMSAVAYIENVELSGSYILVEGWVGEIPFVESSNIQIRIATADGKALLTVSKLFNRADLRNGAGVIIGKAFQCLGRASQDYGSDVTITVEAEGQEIETFAIHGKIGGIKSRGIIRHDTHAGLSGWVFDLSQIRNIEPVRILIDKQWIITPSMNIVRDDVFYTLNGNAMRLGLSLSESQLCAMIRGVQPDFPGFADHDHSVTLFAADRIIDRCDLNYPRKQVRGRIEKDEGGSVSGWAIFDGDDKSIVDLEVHIDGVRYDRTRADIPREDLRKRGLAKHGGGFRYNLPIFLQKGLSPERVAMCFEGTGKAIGRPGMQQTTPGKDLLDKNVSGCFHRVPSSIPVKLPASECTIIIPIFNAPLDLKTCIDSLFRFTSIECTLLLVDDSSTDSGVNNLLKNFEDNKRIRIIYNRTNLGYTRSINEGIKSTPSGDIILLNSDTIVGPRWLEGLQTAAYQNERVGTVTPCSNNAGAFSVPEVGVENVLPPWFEPCDASRLFSQSSLAHYPAVPTGNGFCMYIKRSCLASVGLFDEIAFPRGYGEENDFCMRALNLGFINVLDDKTYVFHKRSASFGDEKTSLYKSGREAVDLKHPHYAYLTSMFTDNKDVLSVRWNFRRALISCQKTGRRPKPRLLYVISTQTGGTPQTNQDLMRSLGDRYECWVLRCDSRLIEVSRLHENGESEVVGATTLENPIRASLHRSAEYDRIVGAFLAEHQIELVHIRHIAWHSLGLFDICTSMLIPIIYSFHDFYSVCPTVKLLDENLIFCSGKCTPGPGPCNPELWPKGSLPALKHRFVLFWQKMFSQQLSKCDHFVTTSFGSREIVLSVFPNLQARSFSVIPHGRTLKMHLHGASEHADDDSRTFRILVPGNISAAKGAFKLMEISEAVHAKGIELHVLGDNQDLPAAPGIVFHGKYKRDEFPSLVRKIRPHIGAVMSIWPETYCHTLTEMWACGLPVLAYNIGAVGERLEHHGGGWLVGLTETSAAIARKIIEIWQDREELAVRLGEVRRWQSECGRIYDNVAMAIEYDKLYRATLTERRVFEPSREEKVSVGLVVSPRDLHTGKAPASTHIRIVERVLNNTNRPFLFREVTPDFDWRSKEAGAYDFVLVQRNTLNLEQANLLISSSRDKGYPVILDLDDDLTEVPTAIDSDGRYAASSSSVMALIKSAEMVLCSTGELKERLLAFGAATCLVPNQLSGRLWGKVLNGSPSDSGKPLQSSKGSWLSVLYMGSVTHQEDLMLVKEAFIQLATLGNAKLFVIGVTKAEGDWFQRVHIPDSAKNYPNFVEWFRELAPSFDLAIAPLVRNKFNAAKSSLKALDYGAAGLPALLSEGAVYKAAAGTFVVQDEDWVSTVQKLCGDVKQLRILGEEGFYRTRTRFLMRTGAEYLDACLMQALKLR